MNSETINHRGQNQSLVIGLVFGVVVSAFFLIYFVTASTVFAATEDKWADAHITGSAASPANAVGASNGTWAGSVNSNTSWTSRWSMENPTGPIDSTQTISVLARKGSNSGTPQLAINLYENGSLVQSIVGNTNVTSTTGQVISGTFDSSVITDESNVEIQVVVTGAGGNPSTRNSAQIDEIEWTVNLMDAVIISGNIYDDSSDSSTTRLSNCDGLTSTMIGIKAGNESVQTGTCDTSTGAYTFSVVGITAGQAITVWINDVSGVYGTSVRRYDGSGNVINLHVRKDRLVVSSDDSNVVTNTILDNYDNNDDGDVVFDVTSGNLTVEDGIRMIQSSSFTPGGNITTSPSSSGTDSVEDGDFIISSGTFNLGTNTLSVGGDFSSASNITDTSGASIIFTATATGHDVTFSSGDNLENITFDGVGGGWTLGSNFTVAGVLALTNGTVNASSRTITLTSSGTPISKGSGVFTAGTSTVQFTSSTGVSSISSGAMTGGSAFYNLVIDGDGGGDSFTTGADIAVTNDFTVNSGDTFSSAHNVTVNGIVSGSGTINHTANTFTHNTTTSKNFGGSSAWTFNNLTLSGASGTTASTGSGSITVSGILTNSASHTFSAGSRTWILTGSGTPFTNSGTFTVGTSTISYRQGATSTIVVPAITFYNLEFAPTAEAPDYTTDSGTLNVTNNLSLGGAGTANLNLLENFTILNVTSSVTIGSGDTLSHGGLITVNGNWTNNGTYTHNNGGIIFNPGSSGTSVVSGTTGTTFYDFTVTQTRAIIHFEVGLTFTFEGDLTVTGEQGKPIWLRSSVTDSQWFIDLEGSSYLNFVNVKDSGCSSSADIDTEAKVYNQGNNDSCWKFVRKGGGAGPAGVGPGTSNAGGGGGGAGGGGGGSGVGEPGEEGSGGGGGDAGVGSQPSP